MREIIEQTLRFYISNEINSFTQSQICSELYALANRLGFQIKTSYGDDGKNSNKIYLDLIVVDADGEGVSAGECDDYVHLSAATLIIQIDKKERIKFYSWEEDDDFIDSINWVVQELKKKL